MLEKMLKLYTMAMTNDVRSPLPHLEGPPGCGKSTVAQQLADTVGVTLHTVNVSRMSPLEVEGVQMPRTKISDDVETMFLQMLHSTVWTSLKPGDIILFDEFLRGFPEIYNGLLDIFTSREVAGFKLPPVFIMAASNTAVAYDKALDDRLLHLPVDDPRKRKAVRKRMAQLIVDAIGLHPKMVPTLEMEDLIQNEVCPMFDVLDQMRAGNSGSSGGASKGHSIRNLIGQAQLREIQTPHLQELIDSNNRMAMHEGKPQFVIITDGKAALGLTGYESKAKSLVGNPKLTEQQAINLSLNLQLIELEERRKQKGITDDDDITDDDVFTS